MHRQKLTTLIVIFMMTVTIASLTEARGRLNLNNNLNVQLRTGNMIRVPEININKGIDPITDINSIINIVPTKFRIPEITQELKNIELIDQSAMAIQSLQIEKFQPSDSSMAKFRAELKAIRLEEENPVLTAVLAEEVAPIIRAKKEVTLLADIKPLTADLQATPVLPAPPKPALALPPKPKAVLLIVPQNCDDCGCQLTNCHCGSSVSRCVKALR